MKLKTLLVDDHPVVRFAVRMLLERANIEVVGEAENGEDAINLIQQSQPHIVLLDMGLPKMDGFQVIMTLRAQMPAVKILILTSQATPFFALRCQQAGANGFIAKTEDLNGLVEAVHVVGRGYNHFPQAEYLEKTNDILSVNDKDALLQLSDRELSVLVNLAKGLSNKDISRKLILSEKTISTYKHRLKTKLRARTIIDLIDIARRNHLLD